MILQVLLLTEKEMVYPLKSKLEKQELPNYFGSMLVDSILLYNCCYTRHKEETNDPQCQVGGPTGVEP